MPEETIQLIDQVTQKGETPAETLRERNRLINEAVQYSIAQKALADLREQIKEGAISRAERDLKLAEEWFDLEEEACQKNEK